jgi:hypothetical protein
MKVDNTDYAAKTRLRNALFRFPAIDQSVVIELMAGSGTLTTQYWTHACDRVIACDKDSRVLELQGRKITTHQLDAYSDAALALIDLGDIVDIDAYGCIIDLIEKIAAQYSNKLIFFTDGSPKYYRNLRAVNDLEPRLQYLSDTYKLEMNITGNCYYGYIYV